MGTLIAIAAGGALGAIARYGIAFLVTSGTLAVNILGCFFMGFIMSYCYSKGLLPYNVQAFVITGFLGSFTTFSAFAFHTVELFKTDMLLALGYITLTVVASIGSLALGVRLAQWAF